MYPTECPGSLEGKSSQAQRMNEKGTRHVLVDDVLSVLCRFVVRRKSRLNAKKNRPTRGFRFVSKNEGQTLYLNLVTWVVWTDSLDCDVLE